MTRRVRRGRVSVTSRGYLSKCLFPRAPGAGAWCARPAAGYYRPARESASAREFHGRSARPPVIWEGNDGDSGAGAAPRGYHDAGAVTMGPEVQHEELVGWLTRSQGWLYGHILTLLPNREAARDVLQQVNLAIWRKADTFDPGRSFLGWAASIAHFQVQAYLRDRGRDRHRFDDALLSTFADDAVNAANAAIAATGQPGSTDADPGDREAALRSCLQRLAPADRDLVLARYEPGASVQAMAARRRK